MAKSTRKIVQMVKVTENSYPLYKSIFEDKRIGSDAKIIMTKALGLMNISLNRGHTNNHFKDFYNYKDGYWYVKYPISNIRHDTGMTDYKARKGIAELAKYDYIVKEPTFRGYIWRLPKYEKYYTKSTRYRPGIDNQRSEDWIFNAPNRSKDNTNKDSKHTNSFQKQVLKWMNITAHGLNLDTEALDPIVKFVESYKHISKYDTSDPLPLLHKLYYVCFIEPRNFYINPRTHYINPTFKVDKSLALLENNDKFRKEIKSDLSDLFEEININTRYNRKHPKKPTRTPNANDNSCLSFLVGKMRTKFANWLNAKAKTLDKVDIDDENEDKHEVGDVPGKLVERNGTYSYQVPNIVSTKPQFKNNDNDDNKDDEDVDVPF